MIPIYVWIAICIVSAAVASLISILIRKKTVEKTIGSAEKKAREIIDDAIKDAEPQKKEMLLLNYLWNLLLSLTCRRENMVMEIILIRL